MTIRSSRRNSPGGRDEGPINVTRPLTLTLEYPLVAGDVSGISIIHEILNKHNVERSCIEYSLCIGFPGSNEERRVKDHEAPMAIFGGLEREGRNPHFIIRPLEIIVKATNYSDQLAPGLRNDYQASFSRLRNALIDFCNTRSCNSNIVPGTATLVCGIHDDGVRHGIRSIGRCV